MQLVELASVHFRTRGVGNIFLANLIKNLKKAHEFVLDSDQEVADLFAFVSTLNVGLWKLVPNASGVIVRINPAVKIEDAIAELRTKCLEPETMDSISEDIQKTLACSPETHPTGSPTGEAQPPTDALADQTLQLTF